VKAKKGDSSLEKRVELLETKLEEFDQIVFASISQILTSVGQNGSLTERVRQIEKSVREISENLELANDQLGDSRLIDAIKRSADEIKASLGIR